MTDHLATLKPYLELHAAEIASLRAQADDLERDIKRRPRPEDELKPRDPKALRRDLAGLRQAIAAHERIMELARDPGVGELLQAVADDPALASEAAADPRAFAAGRGVQLPDSMVIAAQASAAGIAARIVNLDHDLPFELTWTQDGFPPPPQPAQVR